MDNLHDSFALFLKVLAIFLSGYVFIRASYIVYIQSFTNTPYQHRSFRPLKQFNISRFFDFSENTKTIAFIVLSALFIRILTYVAVFLMSAIVDDNSASFFDSFRQQWFRWDASNYTRIAENGYVNHGTDRVFIVFYPLYPLLIKGMNYIVHDSFYSAVIISLTAYCAASVVLYKLLKHEGFSENVIFNTLKYMHIFPFAFFFGMPYTESLFLLLTISCFYLLRTERWFAAGFVGLLATSTRNQGILLLIPFAIEVLNKYPFFSVTDRKFSFSKQHLKAYSPALLLPLGIIFYLIINKVVMGDYFSFLEIQKNHWHNTFVFFADNIYDFYHRSISYNLKQTVGLWLPALISFFVLIFLLVWGINRISASYLLFALACLLISFSPGWLLSGARYISVIFPLYILLALYNENSPRRDELYTIFSVLFLVVFSLFFYGWQIL